MAERERRLTRPYGGVFVARSQVMDADDIHRALRRMSHEILERLQGFEKQWDRFVEQMEANR